MLNKAKIKLPDFMRKSISLVTATVLVLSSIITLPQLVQAEDVENVNYSVFDGMVSNEKPVSENWTFDRRDFSVHPSFLDSDANFSAPKAIVNDDHTVILNWKSVAGADNYIVTVYNVNNPTEVFLIGTPISVAETTATINGLSKYDKINIQVAAYNNTTLISASMVRVTTVINRNDVYKVLYDGSSQTDITGTNGTVSVGPSGSSMKLAGSPDKKYPYRTITFNNCTIPSDAKAIVVWVGQNLDQQFEPPLDIHNSGYTYWLAQFTMGGYSSAVSTSNKQNLYLLPDTPGSLPITQLRDTLTNAWDTKGIIFKQGYMIVPMSFYKDTTTGNPFHGLEGTLKFTINSYRNYDANGTLITNANYPDSYAAYQVRDLYLSNVGYLTDVDAFLALDVDNVYAATTKTVVNCDNYVENENSLKDPISNVAYTFNLSTGLQFGLSSPGADKYGMSLKFTSPETATYDFSTAILPVSNTLTATLKYRMLKVDKSGVESQVWPTEGWNEHRLDAVNGLETPADFIPPEITLQKGESARFEIYADDFDSKSGGTIYVNLGVPTFIKLAPAVISSQGSEKTWVSSHYHITHRINNNFSGSALAAQRDRWVFEMYDRTVNKVEYQHPTNYSTAWNYILFNTIQSKIVGTYSYKNQLNHLLLQPQNVGVNSIMFTAPEAGTAVISTKLENQKTVKVRILKNDVKIYPTNSDWAPLSDISLFATGTEVEIGDEIRFETYSEDGQWYTLTTPPTITIKKGTAVNLPYDTHFAPLWERPYKGQNYVGPYVETAGSVWKFGVGSSIIADSFDAKAGNRLYKAEDATAKKGYYFKDNELEFISDSENGNMNLSFICPQSGIYDFSTGLKLLEGSNAKVRLVKISDTTSENIYPTSNEWFELTPNDDFSALPAQEITANMGDIIRLDVESETAFKVSLASPIINLVDNRSASPTGIASTYKPSDYVAFEKGYSGTVLPIKNRFSFSVFDGTNETPLDLYNSDNKTLSNQQNDVLFDFSNQDDLTAVIKKGNNAVMTFTAPADGVAQVNIPIAKNSALKYKVLYNTAGESEWIVCDGTPIIKENLDMKSEDTIVIMICAESDTTASFGVPTIQLVGDYNNLQDANSVAYFAGLANPMGDAEYKGNIKPRDAIWNYLILKNKDFSVEKCNRFDSEQTYPNLYNETFDAGYYFADNGRLVSDINSKYGISLQFKSPRDQEFVFTSGLRVIASDKDSVKLKVRMLHNEDVIWPDNNDTWNSFDVRVGDDIPIPLTEIETVIDDDVILQVYAEDLEDGQKVQLDLGSPIMYQSKEFRIANADFMTEFYFGSTSLPYSGIEYKGEYVPAQGRWNYDVYDAANDEAKSPDYYDSKNKLISGSFGEIKPTYTAKSEKLEASLFDGYGISNRFVSTFIGDVIFDFASVPTVLNSAALPDTTKIKLRVLLNNKEGIKSLLPAEGDWVTLSNSETTTVFEPQKFHMEKGDEILIQAYAVGGEAKISFEPRLIRYVYVANNKEIFNFKNDYSYPTGASASGKLQVSPFWVYEYAEDADADKIEYKPMTVPGWNIWHAPAPFSNYELSVAPNGFMKIGKCNDKSAPFMNGKHLLVSVGFTIDKDGYLSAMNTVKASKGDKGEYNDARTRITVNGEKVWPLQSDWETIQAGNTIDFNKLDFVIKVSKGDIIRFEFSNANLYDAEKGPIYISANPAMTYSMYDKIYTKTNDIFNMLDDEMFRYFKLLEKNAAVQFDMDYEKHAAIDAIVPEEDFGHENEDESFDLSFEDDSQTTNDQTIQQVIKRIIKKKKGQGRFVLETWEIVLIIVGSVFVLGTATFLSVFLYKRKKKL